jgi:hypothetical protein
VTFIQQYSRRVWPQEPPKGEPVVTHIEIMRPDQDASVAKSRIEHHAVSRGDHNWSASLIVGAVASQLMD